MRRHRLALALIRLSQRPSTPRRKQLHFDLIKQCLIAIGSRP